MQYANSVFEMVMRPLVARGILGAANGHMGEYDGQEEICLPAVMLAPCLVVSHRLRLLLR
jgi:hypothetical protein